MEFRKNVKSVLGKVQAFYKQHKTKLLVCVSTVLTPVLTFAADATPTATTYIDSASITSTLSGVVTQTVALIAAIAPIGLTIFAAKWAWGFAIKFFSKMANKG